MATTDATPNPGTLQEALINDPEFLQAIVQNVLQRLLEHELTQHLEAEPYQRTPDRKGYRNGYKPRRLKTRVGSLELLIPQDRDGTFRTELFEKYQRNEKALVLSLMEMYLQGVSTRKVRDVTEALCPASFSKSTVSDLTQTRRVRPCLDADLAAWRSRPLEVEYPYLTVDARYEHVRVGHELVSLGVLIATGVREDGHREVLAVEVSDTESEATYQAFFRSLKERGLRGVVLVTSDDHKGLKVAIARFFQGVSWQRCQVHFARNLLGRVARKQRKRLADPANPSLHIESHVEESLVCFAFPVEHRGKIRTTNSLERLHQEIKRTRTRSSNEADLVRS